MQRQRDFHIANEHCCKILEYDPCCIPALIRNGEALKAMGDFEISIRIYETAICLLKNKKGILSSYSRNLSYMIDDATIHSRFSVQNLINKLQSIVEFTKFMWKQMEGQNVFS